MHGTKALIQQIAAAMRSDRRATIKAIENTIRLQTREAINMTGAPAGPMQQMTAPIVAKNL
jgi:hypothetical protein